MTAREQGRRLGRAETARREGRYQRAVTGKVRSDGSISLRGDSTHNDELPVSKVYIRLDGLESATDTALWSGWRANYEVILERVRRGGRRLWRIVDVDLEGMEDSAGDLAGSGALPLIDGYTSPLRAYVRNIQEARLRPAATGGLNVTVDPFPYYDTAGTPKFWQGEAEPSGGTTLLAAPAASGGIDTHRWSVVALNPDATTPAYVVYNGTALYITQALSLDHLETVLATVANGYYVLGAVEIETGQTSLIESDFVRPDPRVMLAKRGMMTHTHQNDANGGKLNMRAMSAIACRVYNSADIVVADATDVVLTFNSERRDDGGLHSTASNTSRITITVTGWWSFGCNIQFEGNATGVRNLWVLKNNTDTIWAVRPTVAGASDGRMEINSLYYFTSGDYIEFYVRQNSTVSLNIEVSAQHSPEAWAIFQGT